MVKTDQKKAIELVLNESETSHLSHLKWLLASSIRFVCMTAFARTSAFGLLEKALNEFLDKGHEALFVVGLDFFHTDPSVLNDLFALSKESNLKLFVSRPSWEGEPTAARNFHPKVFIFEGSEPRVIVGSANMTGGGLLTNHESSLMIRDEWGEISTGIKSQIEQLIESKQIVEANPAILNEYERRQAVYKAHERLMKWRVQQTLENNDTLDLNLLRGYLAKMKADKTSYGFASDVSQRRSRRKESIAMLRNIANSTRLTKGRFLELYEPLVSGLWHSGGLHRSKNRIAENAQGFQAAVAALETINSPRIDQAFNTLLKHLLGVKGAGINVLTEILHSFDHRRFPVMNQNSVFGMALAGHSEFPKSPNKFELDADIYVDFCKKAASVRNRLGLRDFTELDALFNYVYWIHPDE
jgi:HKD family nuclease